MDTTGFVSAHSGMFSVTQQGGELYLSYVPEPAVFGLAPPGWARWPQSQSAAAGKS